MVDRVILDIKAADGSASDRTGMTICFQSPAPLDGKMPSRREKKSIMIIPRKYVGIEAKKSARTVIRISAAEYLFSADRIPISTPRTEAIRIEKKARHSVVGNFGKSTSKTGLPD